MGIPRSRREIGKLFCFFSFVKACTRFALLLERLKVSLMNLRVSHDGDHGPWMIHGYKMF